MAVNTFNGFFHIEFDQTLGILNLKKLLFLYKIVGQTACCLMSFALLALFLKLTLKVAH